MPQPTSPADRASGTPSADGAAPTSTADRAVRLLAEAAGDSRQRIPADADDPAVPVAATVVIARDGSGGPEVLLIERPDRGSFAGAWVFPGGKIESTDGPAATEEDLARRAGLRETWEESGLTLDSDALVTLSCWDPPPDWHCASAPGSSLLRRRRVS